VRNLIEEAGRSQDCPTPSLVGRPSAAAANVMRLDSRHNQHRSANSAAVFVQRTASEGEPCTSASNVMSVCAWCLVLPITTKKQICKAGNYN